QNRLESERSRTLHQGEAPTVHVETSNDRARIRAADINRHARVDASQDGLASAARRVVHDERPKHVLSVRDETFDHEAAFGDEQAANAQEFRLAYGPVLRDPYVVGAINSDTRHLENRTLPLAFSRHAAHAQMHVPGD